MKEIGIKSFGSYAPAKVLDNKMLSEMVDTTDEWIYSRTGIKERRIAEDESTSDMGLKAAQACLENIDIDPDTLIVSCGSADKIYPTQSAQIAKDLGLKTTMVMDTSMACSGWIGSMILAQGLMEIGQAENALVIGTEKMSSYVDYKDRSSCILFGDAAGAALLSSTDYEHKIIATTMKSFNEGAEMITMGARNESPFFWQDGKQVYRFVLTEVKVLIAELKEKAGLGTDDYILVPHQANARMFEAIAKDIGLPLEQLVINNENFGNTSSASIGLALDQAARAGRFKKGDKIMMTGFGAGLSLAGMVFEW